MVEKIFCYDNFKGTKLSEKFSFKTLIGHVSEILQQLNPDFVN